MKREKALAYLKRNYDLYLLLLPAMVYIIIFMYMPMYGVQIAFKDYLPSKGIWGSEWVGLKHFTRFFSTYKAWQVIQNTIKLSLYSLAAGFPLPIILALLVNQLPSKKYQRIVQTVTYAPHFISIVILVGMLKLFLSPSYGIINIFIEILGGEAKTFMADPAWFRHLYVLSGLWQGTGFASIIYFAALSGVSPYLHEAAVIDGASKLQRIIHIDIPGILPTATILLILSFAGLMSVGFDKTYLMQNSRNIVVSEVISTYTYKVGLLEGRFSFSAAVGLLNTVINFILLVGINQISRKVSETSLW